MMHMIRIIGGLGFIGTAPVRALAVYGHAIRVIDTVRSRAFPVGGCDVPYNLAAEHPDDVEPRSLYYRLNATGAEHTCAVAEQHRIEPIVFTSTAAVYWPVEKEVDESAPLRPLARSCTHHVGASMYCRKKVAGGVSICRSPRASASAATGASG
jgi:nucleoside-diphosphate-sugar epimerase